MKTVMFINKNSSYIRTLNELHSINSTIYDTCDNVLYESNISSDECISLLNTLHQKLLRDDYASALIINNDLYFYKHIPGEVVVAKWVYAVDHQRWDPVYIH